jgi:hypothetical protein
MNLRIAALGTALALTQLATSNAASSATLWRGVVVVTARAGSADCLAEYGIGESFDVMYRPNLGAPVDETLEVLGRDGALRGTSIDANRTLRAGDLNVTGATRTEGFNFNNVNNPIAITPAAIVATTLTIGMTGTLRNAGIPGCNVTFRASLLPVFDGP